MKLTKQYLRTLVETVLVVASEERIPSEGGTTLLYHFTQEPPENAKEKILLDPKLFGKMGYSKKDLAISAVPRTFFYVNQAEKESFFANKALYTANVPTADIYNLADDPEGVKATVRKENYNILDMDQVLKKVSGWQQGAWGTEDQGKWIKNPGMADGMYYETPSFAVVVMFRPVEAFLSDEQAS